MRFECQHSQAAVGFRTSNGFCKADTQLGCCYCGMQTPWYHVEELLFICSDECYWRYVAAKDCRSSQFATS
jgi:hypothetical protein